jgi:hypothetical protein
MLRGPSSCLVVAFVIAACESGGGGGGGGGGTAASTAPVPVLAPPPSAAYARDIERVCNAERDSGAVDQPEEARQIIVAKWLGAQLETAEVHQLLARIQPMAGPAKGAALDAEARKVGLADCPVARRWKP